MRSATWSGSFDPGQPSVESDYVFVNWTSADIGKTVALSPDTTSDPPRLGVGFTATGSQQFDWVSTAGTLTVLRSGTAGHLDATLSPDKGIGPGEHFPGTGVISIQASWTC